MTTVAVIGAAGAVGKALLERLDADAAVERLIGIDCDEPDMPVAKLEFRTADVRDQLLPVALDGADVVVHLGLTDDGDLGEDTLFATNVNGTRNLLEAVAKVGASRLVVLSGAMVYGAHPDNPLPITERSRLRANPDHAPAYHQLLVEELVAEFDDSHPDTRVVVLRPATVLGPGVDHMLARHLRAPRLLTIAESEPPLQLLHVDDLASALQLGCLGDLEGAYNVAADGWLPSEELAHVLGRRRLAIPEAVAFGITRGLWARHLASVSPGGLHYLMHPWVVSAARIKAAGWQPTRSNRETLREFAAEHHGRWRIGTREVRSRDVVVGGCTVVCAVAGLVVGGRLARRARRG
jgi:nucleoside-diphosphate-sugar epimerase